MTDEELVLRAQEGNEEATEKLLAKYKSIVNKIARSYFLTDGDMEDIVQEGMIGLYKAIKSFNASKTASFKTYSTTCIKHQIQNAIKAATSEKNMILSTAVSIFEPESDEEDELNEIPLPSNIPSPDDKLIEKERFKEIKEKFLEVLSPMEFKVLALYLKGYNYSEIAKMGKISKKSIDNALSRIKNKLSFLKKDK